MSANVKLRDIVVLALLNEQPRYGYELKTMIDHLMSHIIGISSGSLYYGLKKMLQDGLICEEAVERAGRRPERSVYRITDTGREELGNELPRVIFPDAQPYFPLDLALFFFEQLDSEQRVRRLLMRLDYLTHVCRLLDEMEERFGHLSSTAQHMILQHHRRYIKMERSFIDELLQSFAVKPEVQLTDSELREVQAAMDSAKRQLKPEVLFGRQLPIAAGARPA
jgi:DNA-binding PadR family transcriptional regulator